MNCLRDKPLLSRGQTNVVEDESADEHSEHESSVVEGFRECVSVCIEQHCDMALDATLKTRFTLPRLPETATSDTLKPESLCKLFGESGSPSTSDDLNIDLLDPRKVYYIIDNQNKAMPFVVEKPEVVFAAQHQENTSEDPVLLGALCMSVRFGSSEAAENINLVLQKANEDPVEAACKIKIGQATLRLKRTCGISYIKQPESRQIGSAGDIAPIPPLVIQCSAMIDPLPSSDPMHELIREHCKDLFTTGRPMDLCFSTANHETDFRLGLLQQLDHIQTDALQQPPPTVADPSVPFPQVVRMDSCELLGLAIHPNTYCSVMIPVPQELGGKVSHLVLGIHSKRSVSSKSSFLERIGRPQFQQKPKPGTVRDPNILMNQLIPEIKTQLAKVGTFSLEEVDRIARDLYKSKFEDFNTLFTQLDSEQEKEQAQQPVVTDPPREITAEEKYLNNVLSCEGLNLHTVAIKVECYIPEGLWNLLDRHEKRTLTTFAHIFKRNFDAKLLEWSMLREMRTDLHQLKVYPHTQLLPPVWAASNEPLTGDQVGTKLESVLPTGWKPAMCVPLYTVDTRDSFAFDPIIREEWVTLRERKVLKKTWFFHPDQMPSNYSQFIARNPSLASEPRVGVVTYEGLYSEEELKHIEAETLETEKCYLRGEFLPHTGQALLSGRRLKRTKFFFGSRYLWTANQLAHPHAKIASGIRTDVSPVPLWMRDKVEIPMIEAGILEKGFVNSVALNVYHDGEEGLGQHFDDAVRFRQPIYSLRIFSDARLAFGSQLYNFCNGAFCIPMSRGTVTILEQHSFAANGLKHCIRPVDMAGKSAAFILRQMNPHAVADAQLYDWLVDLPHKLHTMAVEVDKQPLSPEGGQQ